MSDSEELIFANEAFYMAFAGQDMQAMKSIWSEKSPATCVHPGWGVISGYDEIIASWLGIMSAPQSPAIEPLEPLVSIEGDVGIVVCFEALNGGFLIATNLFIREDDQWRMIHHQAGPTSSRPARPQGGPVPDNLH